MQQLKLVVFGSGGVGKSSLVLRFTANQYTGEYLPTIEDCYRKSIQFDGKDYVLDILDTAGQDEYKALRDQWVREGQVFIAAFSCVSRETFAALPEICECIRTGQELADDAESSASASDKGKAGAAGGGRDTGPLIVLVATKIDLANQREVTAAEAAAWARENGCVAYVECSALASIGCTDVFHQAVRAYAARRAAQASSSKGGHTPKLAGGLTPNSSRDKKKRSAWSWCTLL